MSRSKQEALLLEERIEKIRKKNEEIERRHLEVEADKQNAAKLNALVQITSPTEDWPVGGRSPHHGCGTSRDNRRSEQNRSQQNYSNNNGSAKCYTYGEKDGPPPDPAYKFLADTARNSDRSHSRQHQQRGRISGRNRGAFTRDRDRGSSHQHSGGRDVPQPEYEAWRAERNRIDNDRISRQKTAEGHWRREWDNEKITQEEEVVRPAGRVSRGGRFRRSNNDWNSYHDYNAHTTQDRVRSRESVPSSPSQVSERDGGGRGMSRGSRGCMRGQRHVEDQTHLIQDCMEGGVLPTHNERNVVNFGESIQISVPNVSPAPPVRRVKVNAPVVAGTGRVGPRQRFRISYSSQSEDEAPPRRIDLQPSRTSSSNIKTPPDSSNNNHTASALSKPPLPPPTGIKQDPRPRRQPIRRLEQGTKLKKQGGKKEIDTIEVSELVNKKEEEEKETTLTVEDCQMEIESGGDDSWEDVATTSGNDSACEELSPCIKSPHSKTDSRLDVNPTQLKSEVFENTQTKSGILQNMERNSGFLQNTEKMSGILQIKEVKMGILQTTEVKSEVLESTETKLGILQNTEEESEILENRETKSRLLQNIDTKSGVLPCTEGKTLVLQNIEEKAVIPQNTEEKSGILEKTETKSGIFQNTEEEEKGARRNTEEKSVMLQNTEQCDIKLNETGTNNSNNESDSTTEVSQVVTNKKVCGVIMQEIVEKTFVPEQSTNCDQLKDNVSTTDFDKSHLDMLVESKEITNGSSDLNSVIEKDTTVSKIAVGTSCEVTDLEEEENIYFSESVENKTEDEIQTEPENKFEQNNEPGKVDVAQNLGNETSDGITTNSVPEEKQATV